MPENPDIERAVKDLAGCWPPPDWLREMIDHYLQTGTFKPDALRRLLGDPSKGVVISSDTSLESFFSK